MEPRVTKRERKLHLSYELPHRVHCTRLYPVKSSNGSTVIIYGHDRGIRILWRGGRVPREPLEQAQEANGIKSTDIVVVDSDDVKPSATEGLVDTSIDEKEELDPDCPYPSIISEVDVDVGAAVLHLAVPSLPLSIQQSSPLFNSHALVALACSNGQTVVINVPLTPPRDATIRELPQYILESRIDLPQSTTLCRSLAVHVHIAVDDDNAETVHSSCSLLVASVAETLHIAKLPIVTGQLPQESDARMIEHRLEHLGKKVNFHPSSHSSQVLVTDVSGAVRVFDPTATQSTSYRPGSRDSAHPDQTQSQGLGRWTVSFNSAYVRDAHAFPRRKQVLDAAWILSGRAVLMLLEDGEWGIWDVSGSLKGGKGIQDFVLRGYLGSVGTESVPVAQQKKGSSKLAPMTPNTRKAKAEDLFAGPTKVAGVAPNGFISITQSTTRTGQSDESVLMNFGSELYSIPSLQTFWQRSTATTSSGALYSSGLTHLSDINLMGENITSTAQFGANSSSANLGQMNTQRDILVSAEHRLIILQNLRPPTPSRALFQKAVEQPTARDQRMLDAGELDVGGMDRMLDNLANNTNHPRRVGFAH
ncbi:Hypothetical protein R9X50_00016900 [Acrodontium crateriforme]|uniref:Nucleoporin NUP37 n=1 Tax=Acrodontium crateriforme TaxID=150365 RepID=A0AAQ3LYB6_9PEZI|nr:Hypothetical protein R9X50_00016900 [Acrodontium crateriforme]